MQPEIEDASTRRGLPHVSLLAGPGELPRLRARLWMGGAHSTAGQPLELAAMESSWVVDCAGDMPPSYRAAASGWTAMVFADLDAHPANLARIQSAALELARALTSFAGARDVVVVCQYGMNRSGLVAGFVLRELGLSGEDAIRRIRSIRPGSLSNDAFRRLIVAYQPRSRP